jgi:hypothetical protein
MKLEIVNPAEIKEWNALLFDNPDYSFFHTSNWAKVLMKSYDYKPLYFSLVQNGKLRALMPVMQVDSLLTGRRGVSLPFTDYCEPILASEIGFDEVFKTITEYGRELRWDYFEFRGAQDFVPNVIPSSHYYGHTLYLDGDEKNIFNKFRGSTRRNIIKAEKEGVQVAIDQTMKSLQEYYRLHCMTRKQQGIPPQPFEFFKNVYDQIISKHLGFVVLASYAEKIIAGAVFIHIKEKAIYKFGASDKSFQHLRANNLIMWEAIRWYCRNGFRSFCFGRTEPGNRGLIQFKEGWLTETRVINYYRYDLSSNKYISKNENYKNYHNIVFGKMPISLLKLAGNLMYKHVG